MVSSIPAELSRSASIAAELGIAVAPSTILRWVVRYAEEFARRWEPFELMVGRSWRADEIYIKVNGRWMYCTERWMNGDGPSART
jgi:transposase-like protein